MRSKESSGGLEGREVGRKGIWKDGKERMGRKGSEKKGGKVRWEEGGGVGAAPAELPLR